MSTEVERIAEEVDACNLPYSMELVRLVDGVSTYELRINGGIREFGDLDDLYEHVRVAKASAKAKVISEFLATARAEARKAALEEAAKVAYGVPHFVADFNALDDAGNLLPGSPYDHGRYDAASAIRALIEHEKEG